MSSMKTNQTAFRLKETTDKRLLKAIVEKRRLPSMNAVVVQLIHEEAKRLKIKWVYH